jgi:hypothetical protein
MSPPKLVPHPKIDGLYATEDGRIFAELRPSPRGGGYHLIRTPFKGARRVARHTLVLETFHGERPPGAVARHLDGDPGNDSAANLAWGSPKENAEDTIAHGRTTKGTRNARAKMSEEVAREILVRRQNGESGRSLAHEFGVTEAAVCDLHKGRTWAHLHTKPPVKTA